MENFNQTLTDDTLIYEIIDNEKYVSLRCFNNEDFKLSVKKEICHFKSKFQEIDILDTFEFGRCLFLDGLIQSCEKYHDIYDNEILKYLKPDTKDILILGGGDGNILNRALEINPNIQVTLIEIDKDVIEISDKYIYNSLFKNKNANIIIDNAFSYLKNPRKEKFEHIVIDLTDNPIGLKFSEIINYYCNVIESSSKLLKRNSYISTYIGCDRIIARSVTKRLNYKFELNVLNIPSFGESCYILHNQIIN